MADDLQLRLTIDGIQPLIQKLGRATAMATLRAPMERSLARLVRLLATYPPPPPNSTYRRSGNLGRAWKSPSPQMSGGELQGTVGNGVRDARGRAYGPFVQGERTQAGIHRGRWTTDEQALRREAPTIQRDFQESIDDALK